MRWSSPEGRADVDKSVSKFSAGSTVDKSPTPEEIGELMAEQFAPPRVYAYEIAEELGCSESSVSKFMTRRRPLPHGIGIESYRAALRRRKALKRGAA